MSNRDRLTTSLAMFERGCFVHIAEEQDRLNANTALRLWYRDLIRSYGWHDPIPHSACYMCPNMRDSEWIDMKHQYPHDFAEAVRIEKELREHDPHFWLHPSAVPLAEVDFEAQHTMFIDRGCTTGCFT